MKLLNSVRVIGSAVECGIGVFMVSVYKRVLVEQWHLGSDASPKSPTVTPNVDL